MHLLLDTNGLILKKRNHCFWIVSKKERRMVSPLRVSTITITAECLLSASAVHLAVQHTIPIFYTHKNGKVTAKLHSSRFVAEESLRTKQTLFQWTNAAFEWVKSNLLLKIHQQNNGLKGKLLKNTFESFLIKQQRLMKKITALELPSSKAKFDQLRILEAQAGKEYWKQYFQLIPSQWSLGKRSSQPAKDQVNCCINYFYGFYYSLTEHAIYLSGLNPYTGLFHQNKYNKAVLSFDLIEPFRPFCDQFVKQLFQQKQIKKTHFEAQKGGLFLNRAGKKMLIPLFFDHLDTPAIFNNQKASPKNHIYRYTNQLKTLIKNSTIHDLISQLRYQ